MGVNLRHNEGREAKTNLELIRMRKFGKVAASAENDEGKDGAD